MDLKKCSKCCIAKPRTEFPSDKTQKEGLSIYCKPCKNEKVRAIRERNKEKYRLKNLEWRKNNPEKVLEAKRKYREKHKPRLNAISRKYREDNKERLNIYKIGYIKERIEKDSVFKLKEQTRKLIGKAFKRKSYNKSTKTFDILGCSYDELYNYLLKSAIKNYPNKNITKDNLMSFDWHIDHIVPISTAKSEDEVLKLNNYKNLQLLTPEDNLKKSDKLTFKMKG